MRRRDAGVRTLGAVVLGYVVIFVVVFLTFSATFLTLGAEGAFRPGSYEVSALWIGLSLVLSFVAAMVGGLVCTVVAPSRRAPTILAAIVLGLGLLLAIPVLTRPSLSSRVRTTDVEDLEAMRNAEQPDWIAIINPVVGAAGVMLGAALRRRSVA